MICDSDVGVVRRLVQCPVHYRWEWGERYRGASFGDETKWAITMTDDGPITLHRNSASISMSHNVAERLREVLAEILTSADPTGKDAP